MNVSSIAREAAAVLRFNRQRSILTTVSLAWGVACFVILYSYGDGFHLALRSAFMSVGQDLVLMFGGQTSAQAGGERSGRRIRLERTDAQAIRESVPMVGAISNEMMMGGMTLVRGYRTQVTMVRAAEPSYQIIRNMSMAAGRWFGPEDETAKRRVAVLGSELAAKLFGEIPPEGEEIAINGLRFTVTGVIRTKTQIANYNTPDNECAYVPFETGSLFRNLKYPDNLVWMPSNPVFRQAALQGVLETLARLHGFSPKDERAVRYFVFNDSMRLVDAMGTALRLLLGFIGTLTLAVGGVGLANIMLVSVTQRTREIGVLKSIGATRRSILWQFLLEALAIVTAGGAVGVAAGWAATSILGSLPLLGPLFHTTSGAGDIHLRISGFAVLTSTAMLETVGLVAGLLPAIKAARLDPIEALRYE